jgi:hypothetical protein
MNKTVTISQLHNTPDGTYINGEVSGWLSQIRPPNGRGPSKAKLSDGSQEIEVSLWGGGVTQWEGQQVTFSGKGMKIQEYKGKKSLSVGDKVNIGAADVNPDLEAATATQARAGIKPPPPAQSPRQSSQNAQERLPVNLPAGQTVGMAVKLAGDMLLSENPKLINDENWAPRLRAAAANIIAISRSLETDTPLEDVPF